MIKAKNKIILFAEQIEEYFREGIVLSPDVLHFIDSTFSNPGIKEFEDIFKDASNIERESLAELVFSPDKAVQIQLEDSLVQAGFEKQDEKDLTELLCSEKLSTHIVFPDGRGRLTVALTDEAVVSFITQLNISWKPDARVLVSLKRMAEQLLKNSKAPMHHPQVDDLTAAVLVSMRNRNINYSDHQTQTICSFIEKADKADPDFITCFELFLDMIDEIKENENLFEILSRRKQQYKETIRKREAYESLIRNSNMETVSLQGITAPFINMDDMRKRIACIDTITLAVYDEIVYCL